MRFCGDKNVKKKIFKVKKGILKWFGARYEDGRVGLRFWVP